MKRILIIALAFVALAFTSCKKEPVGETAVKDASGDWYVKRVVVYADGEKEDIFGPDGMEYTDMFHLITYNTADNTSDEIFIDEQGEFYYKNYAMFLDFKVKAKVDLNTLEFSASAAENYYEDNTVDIQGKIIKNGAMSAGGKPIDSIFMTVKLSDDDYAGILDQLYGQPAGTFEQWDHYEITGVRYTGFVADE